MSKIQDNMQINLVQQWQVVYKQWKNVRIGSPENRKMYKHYKDRNSILTPNYFLLAYVETTNIFVQLWNYNAE